MWLVWLEFALWLIWFVWVWLLRCLLFCFELLLLVELPLVFGVGWIWCI